MYYASIQISSQIDPIQIPDPSINIKITALLLPQHHRHPSLVPPGHHSVYIYNNLNISTNKR